MVMVAERKDARSLYLREAGPRAGSNPVHHPCNITITVNIDILGYGVKSLF
jgi:hypothetical protein